MPEQSQRVPIGELASRVGLEPWEIRKLLDEIPHAKKEVKTKGRRSNYLFPLPEAEQAVLLSKALWDIGFESKERKAILEKMFKDRSLSFESVKKAIKEQPFIEILRLFTSKKITLLERGFFERLIK